MILALPLILAALAYYLIDSVLLSTAIGLASGAGFTRIWREQFRWLGPHYLVLCIMGVILATAYAGMGVAGIFVFALPIFMMYYVQKQYVDRTEASVQELRRLNDELAQANDAVIAASQAIRQLNDELFLTLAKIIDARDPYVHDHAARMADYAVTVGSEMGLSARRIANLRQAALLHDIGKIGISDEVLQKPDKLTEAEYEIIKKHAELGGDFLETSQGLWHLAPFVKYHHERWDGSGYPQGLRDNEIPLEARILAVCDSVEAMITSRPYHKSIVMDQVLQELRRCSGVDFDPEVVDAFIRVAQRNDGKVAAVSSRTLQSSANDQDAIERIIPAVAASVLSNLI